MTDIPPEEQPPREQIPLITVTLTPDAGLLMITLPVTIMLPVDALIQAIQQRNGIAALTQKPRFGRSR